MRKRKQSEWELDDWDVSGYEDTKPRDRIRKQIRQKKENKTTKSRGVFSRSQSNPENYPKNNTYDNYNDLDSSRFRSNQANYGYNNASMPFANGEREESFRDRMEFEQEMEEMYRHRYHDVQNEADFDDYEEELYYDDDPKWPTWIKVLIGIVIAVGICSGFILWGYWNSDFDDKGTAYVVPLELHYERRYVKESDEVLQLLIDIQKTLENDTYQLPNDYTNLSTKLTEENAMLKTKTTAFSKYVNVPTECQSYHTLLINFSLKTQEFITTLLNNYSSSDYEAFRESGMQDFLNYYQNVKQARSDLDELVFRNITPTKGLDDDESNTEDTSNNSTTDTKETNTNSESKNESNKVDSSDDTSQQEEQKNNADDSENTDASGSFGDFTFDDIETEDE